MNIPASNATCSIQWTDEDGETHGCKSAHAFMIFWLWDTKDAMCIFGPFCAAHSAEILDGGVKARRMFERSMALEAEQGSEEHAIVLRTIHDYGVLCGTLHALPPAAMRLDWTQIRQRLANAAPQGDA